MEAQAQARAGTVGPVESAVPQEKNDCSGSSSPTYKTISAPVQPKTQRASIRGKEQDVEIHTWHGEHDPENPFNWSTGYKWFVTVTVCFVSILTGLPAGALGSGNSYLSQRFNVQNQPFPNLYWATTSWNMGAALFPLLFVPLTETAGRMPGYFGAYIVFEIFLFPTAFGMNFATLVVTRFFGGGGSSVAINLVGGSIADVWRGDKARSLPMSLFGFTSVAGIALGPFVGAAIQTIDTSGDINSPWRWIFYVQIIVNGALIPVFWLILKETRADVILAKRAKKLRKETGRPIYAEAELDRESLINRLKVSFQRPTKMLLTEFVVSTFTLWISFAWGILFLFFSSVPQTFSTNYGFDTFQSGLIQLAITVGALIGTLINPVADILYLKSAARNTENPGVPIPEARLYTAIPGSLLFTAGLFWYGWTSQPQYHWIIPTAGIACVGLGIYSIYMGVVNYLTDAYEKYAASALSAASLGRNAFGAFLPLASYQLFQKLGFGWAGSLLGFVGLALSCVPVILVIKGEEIRKRSPFMLEAMYDEGDANQRRDSLRGSGAGPRGSVAGGSRHNSFGP